MRHKHYDLILEWACGAEIEYFSKGINKWERSPSPAWHDSYEYRIKPEHKPDVVLYSYVDKIHITNYAFVTSAHDLEHMKSSSYKKPNLKLTYDGETNELKSVEKI